MKYPSIKLVFDRKKTASKTKKGLVQIEISLNRQRKFVSTGVKVYLGQWDDRKRVVRHDDSIHLNQVLEALISKANSFVAEAVKSGSELSVENIADEINDQTSVPSFLCFIEDRIKNRSDLKNQRKVNIERSTTCLYGLVRLSI